jgi:hypothetical protein
MKTILTVLVMAAVVGATAAEYVSSSASGTTSAAVTFAGGAGPLRLLQVDVTSDKAASVITWRVGDGEVASLLAPAASTVTNVVTSASNITNDDVVLIQAADGTVLEKTVYSVSALAATRLTISERLSTNLSIGDAVYEETGTTAALLADGEADSTSLHVATTNGFVANGYVLAGAVVLQIASVGTTNITLTAVLPATLEAGVAVLRLVQTNGLVRLPAAVGDFAVTANVNTNLVANDRLLFITANGDLVRSRFTGQEAVTLDTVNFTATTGKALVAGDSVYDSNTKTSPVGAASLRLSGPAVWVSPRGRPARLSLDGTSAVKVNVVNGVYE